MEENKGYKNMVEYKEEIIPEFNISFDEDKEIKLDTENYNAEIESKKEIGEVLRKIKENEKAYRNEIKEETENNFYFSVIFRNSKEMNEFIA